VTWATIAVSSWLCISDIQRRGGMQQIPRCTDARQDPTLTECFHIIGGSLDMEPYHSATLCGCSASPPTESIYTQVQDILPAPSEPVSPNQDSSIQASDALTCIRQQFCEGLYIAEGRYCNPDNTGPLMSVIHEPSMIPLSSPKEGSFSGPCEFPKRPNYNH
jgi:hypothetical protein